MKRLMIILLLAILPYQFAWSAAAAYCEHGSQSASHFGHHEHEIDDDYHERLNDGKTAKVHGDCSYCQASVVQAPLFMQAVPDAIPAPRIYAALPPISFSSHIPDGPRRPDRLPVA